MGMALGPWLSLRLFSGAVTKSSDKIGFFVQLRSFKDFENYCSFELWKLK